MVLCLVFSKGTKCTNLVLAKTTGQPKKAVKAHCSFPTVPDKFLKISCREAILVSWQNCGYCQHYHAYKINTNRKGQITQDKIRFAFFCILLNTIIILLLIIINYNNNKERSSQWWEHLGRYLESRLPSDGDLLALKNHQYKESG